MVFGRKKDTNKLLRILHHNIMIHTCKYIFFLIYLDTFYVYKAKCIYAYRLIIYNLRHNWSYHGN